MSLSISPDVERLIHDRVESGPYESVDHLLREALDALRSRDNEAASNREAWREELDRRYKRSGAGQIEWVDGEKAFELLHDRHQAHRQSRA